jgi:hypothetical protein
VLLHQVLEAFERGDLELDCPDMRVQQEGVKQPMTYCGPGLIRQTSDRKLEFRLFCTAKVGEQQLRDLLFPEGSVDAGQLVPGHHYYSLEATDQHGRLWASNRFQIDRHIGNGLVIFGSPLSISYREQAMQTGCGLDLRVRGEFDIPANNFTNETIAIGGEHVASESRLNAAKFEALGYGFLIKRESGWLSIRAETKAGDLPEHMETRVIEALQFVLGRSLWWSVMSKVAGGDEVTCLRAERGRPGPRLPPPFGFQASPDVSPGWRLFEKYLAHIWNCRGDKFHSTSAWLHMARDAKTGSVFSSGLALGVAIEGVLKNEFSEVGEHSPDPHENIRAAREHVNRWDGDARLKSRILGSIDGMLEVRAKDRLRVLKVQGIVTEKQIDAWSRLRNSAAHARPPEDGELQKWIDLESTGLVMLYHLIFAAIGYMGEYTDYATRNWPVAHYMSVRTSGGE